MVVVDAVVAVLSSVSRKLGRRLVVVTLVALGVVGVFASAAFIPICSSGDDPTASRCLSYVEVEGNYAP